MNYNIILGLRTYGRRIAVNKRVVGIGLSVACAIIPFTNWMIPFLIRLKGNWYFEVK